MKHSLSGQYDTFASPEPCVHPSAPLEKHDNDVRIFSGRDGSFQCRRCGNCCLWTGYVRLMPGEIDSIADFLELKAEEFTQRFTVLTSDRQGLALTEHPDGSCIFYSRSSSACRIESVKPRQCRDFPHRWRFPGWEKECAGAN